MTMEERTAIEERITNIFYSGFMNHPASVSDPALALDSAREDASNALPAGVHGTFNDEKLTFTIDESEE